MSTLALGVAGATVAGLSIVLDKYRPTNHNPNPWSVRGLFNVSRLSPKFEQVINEIDGTLTSCFRSARVNAIIGGVPTSRHQKGCACDIVPGGIYKGDPRPAALHLWRMVKRGELGNVHKVIAEQNKPSTGWVHISWREPWDAARNPTLHYKPPGGKIGKWIDQ